MNNKRKPGGIGRIVLPLVLFLIVEYVAQSVFSVLAFLPHMEEMLKAFPVEEMGAGADTTQVFADMMMKMMEILQPYQVQILGGTALCTFVLSFLLFSKDRKQEGVLKSGQNTQGRYFWIVVLGFAVCLGANCLNLMMTLAFGNMQYQEASAVVYAAPFWVQVLVLGIMIPLSEEMMFRGLLFKRMRGDKSFMFAAVMSALLFAFIHGTTAQIYYTVFIGVMLAYVYEKYQTIKAPILLHMTANLVSVCGTETGYFDRLFRAPGNMAILLVISAFFGAVMFARIRKIETGQQENDQQEKELTE